MAWTGYQLFLAGLLVVTGSINTIATKWADKGVAIGAPNNTMSDGNSTSIPHKFNHSFLQALGMFFGEFTCLIFFKVMYWITVGKRQEPSDQEGTPSLLRGSRTFNPIIFLAPTLCDMMGTTTMYIGLNLTYASSAQMLRGAVIIFTGIFSVLFLKRRLRAYQWIAMVIVLLGLGVVGMADYFFGDNNANDAPNVMLGNVLILGAQVITATQMVLEEKFVNGNNVPPLQAVGWEGLFGCICMGLLLIPLYFIRHNGAPIEDSLDGIYQLFNSGQIALGYFGTVVSISFFNFAGVSVTKEMSATTRMVLDSVRTLFIWAVTVALTWQKFIPMTVGGFVILVLGMMVYNNVLIVPFLVSQGWMEDPAIRDEEDRRRLEDEEDDDA